MWVAQGHKDYELLDVTDGERLERWGAYTLVRPDPQILWKEPRRHKSWLKPDARYERSADGGGSWSRHKLPESWDITWRGLRFLVRPTGFKHTGLFPEQAANWDMLTERIALRTPGKPFRVLNLFAYTGAATVVCAKAGAVVTHVDAARGMVAWAKENAQRNGVEARWIVDDCAAFVARELRRGNRYEAILMDPPSYGRGANGRVWKLEDDLYNLLKDTAGLLSDDARLLFLGAYTTGLAPSVLRCLLELTVLPRFGGRAEAEELGLTVGQSKLILPCGATGRWMQS